MYKSNFIVEKHFINLTHPIVDSNIKLAELLDSSRTTTQNKSLGIEGTVNKCFKYLPPKWTHYILNLFNVIWDSKD